MKFFNSYKNTWSSKLKAIWKLICKILPIKDIKKDYSKFINFSLD